MTWLPLLFSPFAGSFLGVLIRRLPVGRPVGMVRSACESCGRVLGWGEMIPVVSYAAQRGRCRQCGAPIAPMHLAVELAAMVVAASAMLVDTGPALWADCVLGWALLALAWVDGGHMRLPDVITLPLILLGLGATTVLTPWAVGDHAMAAVAGYAAFRAVALLYRRWRGREGLGQGDAKLLAAAGAWVGLEALPNVVLGGALLGLATALVWRLQGRAVSGATALPFGTHLAAALWLVYLWERTLLY